MILRCFAVSIRIISGCKGITKALLWRGLFFFPKFLNCPLVPQYPKGYTDAIIKTTAKEADMTISEIRRNYPTASFYFFDADGWALRGTPFLHEKVTRFSVDGDTVFIYL